MIEKNSPHQPNAGRLLLMQFTSIFIACEQAPKWVILCSVRFALCSLIFFALRPTSEANSQASTFIFWPIMGRQMLVNCCVADSCVRGPGLFSILCKINEIYAHVYILLSYLLFHKVIWHSFPVWKSIRDFDACYCWKTESLNENNKECLSLLNPCHSSAESTC